MAQVIVFCGGKCGGTTLANTFHKNGYMSHHFHDIKCKGLFGTTIETDNIFDFIDENSKDNNVYIIDVYRTPIERSISSFFQNIDIHLPNYKNLTIEDIIKFYNDNKLYLIEDYHPINTMLKNTIFCRLIILILKQNITLLEKTIKYLLNYCLKI